MPHYYTNNVMKLKMIVGMASSETKGLIGKLDEQCNALQNAMETALESDMDLQKIHALLDDLAQKTDRFHMGLRKTLCSMKSDIPRQMPDYETGKIAFEPVDIQFDASFPLFTITLPPLLPYKMEKGANFLPDLVRYNTEKFHSRWFAEHGSRIRITPAAVVFVHCTPKSGWTGVKDYDNLERKRVLDALGIEGMFSDNSMRMIEFNMMGWARENCTVIHITTLKQFPALFEKLDFSAYKSPVKWCHE